MSTYRITTRFIPLGSTDRKLVANIDKQWCRTRLPEISAIFAPAQLEFVFGSLDLPSFDDRLNLDVPPGDDPNGIETARKIHAERFPHELAVFVRRYLKKDANDTRYKAFNYASVQADYVIAEPGSSEWGLAHEFGHFFGLPHTFDDDLLRDLAAVSTVPERLKILSDLLGNAIANDQVARHEAMTLLDGDGA